MKKMVMIYRLPKIKIPNYLTAFSLSQQHPCISVSWAVRWYQLWKFRFSYSAAATYSFEGVISETDIKHSLDAFVKSAELLQPDTDKTNTLHAIFNIEASEWEIQSLNEKLQQIRRQKERE